MSRRNRYPHCTCSGFHRGELNPCIVCLLYAVRSEQRRLSGLADSAERLGLYNLAASFRDPVSRSIGSLRHVLTDHLADLRAIEPMLPIKDSAGGKS